MRAYRVIKKIFFNAAPTKFKFFLLDIKKFEKQKKSKKCEKEIKM